MKAKTFLIVCVALLGIALAGNAGADTINDTYWGGTVSTGNPTQYGDVVQVAGSHNFEVDYATVTRSGNLMTVKLYGGYFSPGNSDRLTWTPGDLYISSSGWAASNSSDPLHYSTDTFSSSEGWNYVVSLADGKVYGLDYGTLTYTSAPSSGYIIRQSQAFTGGYGTLVSQGSVDKGWTHNGSYLSFTFDTSGLSLQDNFGIHWTMRCGNDVFDAPVGASEPSTMILLGFGLIGVGAFGRKYNKTGASA